MTNLMEIFEKEQIQKLTLKKRIPAFRSGDTIKVILKIILSGWKSTKKNFINA